ncbi:unnamed protein product [Heterobilharzia americana]|nr:unnamed protein product [Heterobilharzia americana]
MYNPGTPNFAEASHSADSLRSTNLIDFSQPSFKGQQLYDSNHENTQISQTSQRVASGTESAFQYPVQPNAIDAMEGHYLNESFQNPNSMSGSLSFTPGNQYHQPNSSVPQLISATENPSINGLPSTPNFTESMQKPVWGSSSEGHHQYQRSEVKPYLQSSLPPSMLHYILLRLTGIFTQILSQLSPRSEADHYDKVARSDPNLPQGYTGYSQPSNPRYQSPILLTPSSHPTSSFSNTQAPAEFVNRQQHLTPVGPQLNNPTAMLLPPNPKVFAVNQHVPPSTLANDMSSANISSSVGSPNLYPPPVMNEIHPISTSTGSSGITPSLPPVPTPNMNATYQTYPNKCLLVQETCGGLMFLDIQERCLLPSDGPDLPPKPVLTTPINCDPDIMRCTLTNVPSNSKLLTRCRLPLGLVMHPFRDLTNLHTINTTTIVRCRSCRTYINPFVQFMDSGRRWRCPVCFLANTVPDDFYYDPGTQTYGDPSRRPEIRSATVEFIAPSEYMVRPPQPATYLFCFDVSHNAIATGYLQLACQRLEALIGRIPGDSRRQIAFMTFNSSVHYYKLCGETMRMLICPDLEDLFLPDNEGLLNRIEDCTEVLQEFLLHLHENFVNSNDTGNCLGSALQAALKLTGPTGGRISVFNTCLPNVGAGALSLREEPSDRSSVDVKHLNLSTDFYKTYALDCAHQQVAVDMFIFNSQYCDITTISGASRFSSGVIHHYPDFCYSPNEDTIHENEQLSNVSKSLPMGSNDSSKHQFPECIEVEKFRRDFDRYLTRKIGFEAVMRIRCTQGLSIQTFHGSCFVRSTDLMSLPNVSPDSGYAVQLDLSENLEKCATVCCQAAVLYTSSKGDRRIRVHTLCLPVVHTPTEVFQGADQGAIACLLSKMAVDRTISSGLSNAREALANAVADALSAYATNSGISPNSNPSAYVGHGEDVSPGSNTGSDILRQLLGISSPNELPVQGGPFTLPINISSEKQSALKDGDTSVPVSRRRLSALITLLRRRRPVNNALVCMRHDAPASLRSLFLSYMIEDKTESAPSYQEFLQMIQNLVRT